MAEASEEAKDIEKLYEYGERLNEVKDKSQVPDSIDFRNPHFRILAIDQWICYW